MPSPDGSTHPPELELLLGFLWRTHMSTAGDLPRIVAEQLDGIGARDTSLLLVDYEQRVLKPLGSGSGDVPVAGTVAGRAFSSTAVVVLPADEQGSRRVWLPLLDGTERVGAMGVTLDREPSKGDLEFLERFAHLTAMIIVTKDAYSDRFKVVRRRKRMTIASELVQEMAPPLVFATRDLTVAGMLEPAYDNGGDAFDYAVNERVLHAAIFDAMGHGLAAAGVAAFALAAYRHSRRSGHDLARTYAVIDDAVGRQFPEDRFVTAAIAQLDLDTGLLQWISAGHPPPLLLRGGRHPRLLETTPATPLGVTAGPELPAVAGEALEPGDLVLLYTDGLTESRDEDGRMLGTDGLGEFIERQAAAGETAPETLRRLQQVIVDRVDLRDDATALLLQWGLTETGILPEPG